MNKRKIVPLIILDIILIAAAAVVMIQRYHALTEIVLLTPPPLAASPETVPAPMETSPAPLPAVSSAPAVAAESAPTPPETVPTRNIGFAFYNTRARRVTITGEFNGWKRVPMKRGKNRKWTISLPLEPGTYAYNFVVDGKMVKDPNNPRSCNSGHGFLSSSLTVEPLTHETIQPQ